MRMVASEISRAEGLAIALKSSSRADQQKMREGITCQLLDDRCCKPKLNGFPQRFGNANNIGIRDFHAQSFLFPAG